MMLEMDSVKWEKHIDGSSDQGSLVRPDDANNSKTA
jgi:hypothetical protein